MASLVICIPTYQRNRELAELLDALQRQALPQGNVQVRILVIGNNPDGRETEVVEAARAAGGPLAIGHVQELRPGVVHVRNRALAETIEDDFIAFIDDDELPAEGWLAELWRRQAETGASVVFGNVEALFEEEPAGWMRRGDFHSKRVARDGFRQKPGATDNCLIRLEPVRRHALSFDARLSLVGGEDTLFFDALLQAGEIFADAAAATTLERVPPARATLGWLLKRWRRTGMTDALMIARRRGGGWVTRPRAAIEGILRVLAGGAFAAFAWVLSGGRLTESVAQRLYTYQRGLGMIDFAMGRLVLEYARSETPVSSQSLA